MTIDGNRFCFNGEEVNVLGLCRDGERYIFVFPDRRRAELLRIFGTFAADPELRFSWYDAAVLSHKVREVRKK